MDSYKKLINNSVIFALGNLGSKIITILLVPLYTYYLTPEEYGMVDLVISTSSLFLPLISLSVYDSVLRYILDRETNKNKILTNGLIVSLIGSLLSVLLLPILFNLELSNTLIINLILILNLQSYQSLFSQFTRSIGQIKIYAYNGVVMSISLCLLNILFLTVLKSGIQGYFWSIIGSNIVSLIYLFLKINIRGNIVFKTFEIKTITKMLKYSIPLIPNSLMWWLMNASNKYFLFVYIGASANGLFAIANKIPGLLSIINSIFNQSWQLFAIEEFKSKNNRELYSTVFLYFSSILFVGTSFILWVLKPLIYFSFDETYFISWRYTPFLLLGLVFSCFSGFYAQNYIAAKKTNGVFKTSLYGGICSLIMNFIFIPSFGIIGASFSTLLSSLLVWIIRVRDTKKYMQIDIDKKMVIINVIFISVQILVMYINIDALLEFFINGLILFFILIYNKKVVLSLIKGIKNRDFF